MMDLTRPLLLDGATGTELQKAGFSGGGSAEQWVLEHPEVLIDLQRRYVAAGSQVLYAPTFGANRAKLAGWGLADQVEEYNRRLVALSRGVADGRAWVAGDLAPTGQFLYPLGGMSFEDMVAVYAEQAAALERAGVDIFVAETMMTLPEARAAVLAVKSVSAKPVVVSFTCDKNGRTLTGTDITAALVVMQSMGVDAFGLNCSAGPAELLVQLRRLREYARIPLLAKPNAGLPTVENGTAVYHCPPEEFTALTGEMAAAGVTLFGGCCGTTPEHIRALGEAIRDLRPAPPAPIHGDALPSSEKSPIHLLPQAPWGPLLPCDESLCDSMEDALEEEPPILSIALRPGDDLSQFAEVQYGITCALRLVCDDGVLLEEALRLYQGRAIYGGGLAPEALRSLGEKYGLIV